MPIMVVMRLPVLGHDGWHRNDKVGETRVPLGAALGEGHNGNGLSPRWVYGVLRYSARAILALRIN